MHVVVAVPSELQLLLLYDKLPEELSHNLLNFQAVMLGLADHLLKEEGEVKLQMVEQHVVDVDDGVVVAAAAAVVADADTDVVLQNALLVEHIQMDKQAWEESSIVLLMLLVCWPKQPRLAAAGCFPCFRYS